MIDAAAQRELRKIKNWLLVVLRFAGALRRQLSKIDDDRLRRALESALKIGRPATNAGGSRRWHGEELWRGLPIRQ